MYRRVLCITLVIAVAFAALVSADGVCTGYPKTYNGKPCASTTRYWDGQMGACGCGTGNTNPFSWQWTKPTAAASAPIYGSGSWCGSGCGKCYKLTPTSVGASPNGKGAINTESLVIKVTNLCPSGGNEAWCAMDVNSYDYDAHFDLMDYNMAGIITAQGWDNPEVTYEEVSCADNGYEDWNCQCADGESSTSGSSSSTSGSSVTKAPASSATTKPVSSTTTTTTKSAATTKPVSSSTTTTTTTKSPATTKPTNKAPASGSDESNTGSDSTGSPVVISVNQGTSSWWFGFSIVSGPKSATVEVKDSASNTWSSASYNGDQYWGMYFYNPAAEMKLPLSLRFTSDGKTVTASDVITSFTGGNVDMNVNL